MQEVEEEAV